ncbi:unnamed protein product [Meloidogyne enterolobii]|uniref:Uncharacterized protein n=1 Tax=Meloidogyne enterolobii TaxID=390850 RepID=A0ACB0XP55_MELEN
MQGAKLLDIFIFFSLNGNSISYLPSGVRVTDFLNNSNAFLSSSFNGLSVIPKDSNSQNFSTFSIEKIFDSFKFRLITPLPERTFPSFVCITENPF